MKPDYNISINKKWVVAASKVQTCRTKTAFVVCSVPFLQDVVRQVLQKCDGIEQNITAVFLF